MAVILSEPDSTYGPFAERTTRKFGGPASASGDATVIKDENGTPIPGASLTTMTYTLFSEHSLAIINSRDHVDCKANVGVDGVFTLILTAADMQIVDDTISIENHRLLLEWTYDSGKAGKYEARITVKNLAKVP